MTGALDLQPSVSDGDLARAAAEGDREAFAEIYDRYADRLYDFCVGLLGDRDAAADCVQDAFCVAATDLGGLREPDKLRPWLYSIARHHAMRRLRHRYREEVSDELPDMISHEASPETLAGHSELARLVAEAAGGLSDRDRELLDLSYRHGLDGPELAEALGVTLTSANTMMFRLRQTVERCLGALLVARGAQANPHACPELAEILKGWDGKFSVLMRKRMARHIDACHTCEQDQRQQFNPVALLGSTAVFIPAPAALRRQTLDRVQLTSASSSMVVASGPSARPSSAEISGPSAGSRLAGKRRMALVVGIPLLCLGLTIPLFPRQEDPVSRVVDIGTGSSEGPLPLVPAVIKSAPTPARQKPIPTGGTVQPSVPTSQAKATPIANPPSAGTGSNTSGSAPAPAPAPVLPNPGPNIGPLYPPLINGPIANFNGPIANSDPKVTTTDDQVDTDTTGGTTGGTTSGTTTGDTTGGSTTTGGITGGNTTTGGTTTGGTTSGGTKPGTTTGGTTSGGTTSGGTKPGTTSGGTKPGTTSGGTKPGTTTGGTTSGGTKTGTNTNANSLTKGTTSTSK